MNRLNRPDISGVKLGFLGLSPAEEKFVDIKVKLYQVLCNLESEHPEIYVESNIDTIDSIIYNISKFPVSISDIGALLIY